MDQTKAKQFHHALMMARNWAEVAGMLLEELDPKESTVDVVARDIVAIKTTLDAWKEHAQVCALSRK